MRSCSAWPSLRCPSACGRPGAPTPAYDFTLSVVDSLGNETVAQVDLSGSKTIDDVCAKIEAALGGKIEAQLTAFGNGIELINADPAGGTITLTADPACIAPEDDIRDAIQREKTIKHWPRVWKVRLIHALNPEWEDLYDTLI